MIQVNLGFLLVSLLVISSLSSAASLNAISSNAKTSNLSIYVIMDTSKNAIDSIKFENSIFNNILSWIKEKPGLHFGMTIYPPHSSQSTSEVVQRLSTVSSAEFETVKMKLLSNVKLIDQVRSVENALNALNSTFNLLESVDWQNDSSMCFWFSGDMILPISPKYLAHFRTVINKLMKKCNFYIVNMGQSKEKNQKSLEKLAKNLKIINMTNNLFIDLLYINIMNRMKWTIRPKKRTNLTSRWL